jgi:hypothetical protein
MDIPFQHMMKLCLVVITALAGLSFHITTVPHLAALLGAGPEAICGQMASTATTSPSDFCPANQLPCGSIPTPDAAPATGTPACCTPSTPTPLSPPLWLSPTPTPPGTTGTPSQLVVTVPNPGLLFQNVTSGSTASQMLWLGNSGTTPLSWVAQSQTSDGAPWLTLSPASSVLAPGTTQEAITVTVNAQNLAPGLYQGSLTFLWTGGSQTVPVALIVSQEGAPPPVATPTTGPAPVWTPAASLPPCPATPCAPASSLPSNGSSLPTTGGTGLLCPGTDPSGGTGRSTCSAQSPYGFTTPHAESRLVSLYAELGVCWLRYQIHEAALVTSSGAYQWNQLDTVVAAMNTAHIHLDVPLECFAPPGGGTDACFSHPTLPTPTQMAAFATAIATRYDGKHGHGRIDAFEIGNEEYDFFPPSRYGPILQAGYQAIKAIDPSFLVGMYGTARPSLAHLTSVMSALRPYTNDFDYANFHYYAHGGDPTVSTSDHPSFAATWQLIAHQLPGKPIWCTEVGWPTAPLPGIQAVSPQLQAQYMQDVLTSAAGSGVITRLFWFTIDDGTQPDDIAPNGTALPAFATFRAFVAAHPLWTQVSGPP